MRAQRDERTRRLTELVDGLRGWLAAHLPAEWREPVFPRMTPPGGDDVDGLRISRAWQQRLHDGGWAAPGWPQQHGGRGFALDERLAVAREMALARAPLPIGFQAVDLIGPTLIEHAAPDLLRRLLPGMLSGREIWCQGYSEPEAGSDLASMRTTARREGDQYVVTGQKTWTTAGYHADWCLLLARTGAPGSRHAGISCFAVSMSAPGIEWTPTPTLTGASEFGDMFLDGVRIPVEQRIGPENDGWRVAMSSLGHERLLASNTAYVTTRLTALLDLVRRQRASPATREHVARLVVRVRVLEGLEARALRLGMAGDPQFPVWASMVKLSGTVLRQDLAERALAVLGSAGIAPAAAAAGGCGDDVASVWAREALESRACTIYAGSSEIQRTILGERGLGLPR